MDIWRILLKFLLSSLSMLDYSNIPHRMCSLFLIGQCSLISYIAIPVCCNNSHMETPGVQVILFITRTVPMGMLQSMGCKELDTTEWLNWTDLNWTIIELNITMTEQSKVCLSIHSFLEIKTMYSSLQDNMKKKIRCP